MARGDEKNRAQIGQAVRQGPAQDPEVMMARLIEQRVAPLLRRIERLEDDVRQLQEDA